MSGVKIPIEKKIRDPDAAANSKRKLRFDHLTFAQFIFIKTLKTGGTSLEQVLWKHCGKEDVLTPMVPRDERNRAAADGMIPQNYLKPSRQIPLRRKIVNFSGKKRCSALRRAFAGLAGP